MMGQRSHRHMLESPVKDNEEREKIKMYRVGDIETYFNISARSTSSESDSTDSIGIIACSDPPSSDTDSESEWIPYIELGRIRMCVRDVHGLPNAMYKPEAFSYKILLYIYIVQLHKVLQWCDRNAEFAPSRGLARALSQVWPTVWAI
jgi:hypothetical protein